MIKLGQKLDDRYRLTSYIGTGGMAEVYEATDIISKNSVAIKVLKEDLLKTPKSLIMFQKEMNYSASLNHHNIVRVFNGGEVENRPYIVYEYMKGQTLREKLDFNTKFTSLVTCQMMIQICDAVGYIHEHGIYHRDIKPQNIFYMSDGTIKISDFGIAIRKSELLKEDSKSVMGTPFYLAPELSKGFKASEQSDIYAMGITMFELVTGRLPFEANDPVEAAIKHIKSPFPNPKMFNNEISDSVAQIIIKATQKDPKNRYKSAFEMKEAIENAMNNKENFKGERKGFFSRLFGLK